MRTYSEYGNTDNSQTYLNIIADKSTDKKSYRDAFTKLGEILGNKVLSDNSSGNDKILVACANEDADWLAKGFIKGLSRLNVKVAVFWNSRIEIQVGEEKLPIAPIQKMYIESDGNVDNLIIVKSIINTSCVVKTQLLRLLTKYNPKNILIIAPVMFKDAQNSLKKEFPADVFSKMKFYYLAEDDECQDGIVIPGIGGNVYERLGLENISVKNQYIPELIKERLK